MQNLIQAAKKDISQLEQEIQAIEARLAEKKAMYVKLLELLEITGDRPLKKRGRKPKALAGLTPKPVKGAKRGPKPKGKKGPRPGRKPAGEDTLPTLIVQVLQDAGAPMNAKEILALLQKKGWQTSSGDPQAMVYKTLHRIEKLKMVSKASRGKYDVPK